MAGLAVSERSVYVTLNCTAAFLTHVEETTDDRREVSAQREFLSFLTMQVVDRGFLGSL